MPSSLHSVNPLGRAPRRPSVRRAQSSGPGKFNPFGIAHVILVVLASFASRAAAIGTTVKSIDTGQYHTCALMDDGSLMCWGSNDDGKLGMLKLPNTYATSPVGPVNLGSGRTAKAVSLGDSHTCAILDDDTLKCWGHGGYGRLGYGDTTEREDPETTAVVNLGSGRTAKAVSTGKEHTCAILDDDTLKCRGKVTGLSSPTISTSPPSTAVPLGAGVTSVSASMQSTTCATLTNGGLKCWGNNGYYQVGDGTNTNRATPVDVDLGTSYKMVSVAVSSACAILNDGSMKCWGDNEGLTTPLSMNNLPVSMTLAPVVTLTLLRRRR